MNWLKKEITRGTNDNITFIDIYELFIEDENRVIMFKIPTTWRGFPYDRNDDETVPLN